VEIELFRAEEQMEGRTDMTNLTVAFHNFANASNNEKINLFCIGFLYTVCINRRCIGKISSRLHIWTIKQD